MLNIGATELIIILVVALLVLGPGRLPDVATGLGKAIREFKKAARDITSQLEVDESVAKPFNELRSALNDVPTTARPAVPPPADAVAREADGSVAATSPTALGAHEAAAHEHPPAAAHDAAAQIAPAAPPSPAPVATAASHKA